MWSYIWTQLPSSVLGLYCTNDSCHSRVRLFGSNYKCYLQHTNAEAKPRLALNGNFKSPLLSCLVLLLLYLLILNLLSLLGSSFTLLHSSNLDFSFTVSLRCGHRWWIKWAWTGNQHWPNSCCTFIAESKFTDPVFVSHRYDLVFTAHWSTQRKTVQGMSLPLSVISDPTRILWHCSRPSVPWVLSHCTRLILRASICTLLMVLMMICLCLNIYVFDVFLYIYI